MSNFNLPSGCTDAMVDEAMGGNELRCDGCGGETDDLEQERVRGEYRWLCGSCSAAYERHCEDRHEMLSELLKEEQADE